MIYVAEIVAAVDDAGTTQTFLFSTRGFTTSPTDTPANTTAKERLAQPLNYSRALDPYVPLGLVTTGYGECVLRNPDGSLDAWARYGVSDRSFTLRASADGVGAYPSAWTTILVASMERVEASISAIRIILRDGAKSYLDRIICQSFAGTGSLEGSSLLAGTPKPRIYGVPFNAPLILLNQGSGSDIYMVSDKPYCNFDMGCFDGRAYLVEATGGYVADYATLAGTTVPPGQFRQAVADSVVKFGSVPTYTPTSDPRQTDSVGTIAFERSGEVLYSLLFDAGISDIPSYIKTTIWGGSSYWVRDFTTTYAHVLNEILLGLHAYLYFDRNSIVQAGQLAPPSGAVWTFTPANSKALTVQQVHPKSITVRGIRNFNPSPLSDTATSVDISFRRVLQNEWLYSAHTDVTSAKFIGDHQLNINYVGSTGSLSVMTFVDDFEDLFGVARDVIELTAPLSLSLITTVDIGSEVTVRWPRYSLTSGVSAVVSGIRYELASGTVVFTLWR